MFAGFDHAALAGGSYGTLSDHAASARCQKRP
jgi:hypothetical protein